MHDTTAVAVIIHLLKPIGCTTLIQNCRRNTTLGMNTVLLKTVYRYV